MFFKDIFNRPPDFGEILDKAIEVGASDILLRRGLPIMYKVGGVWYRFSEEDLPDMTPYLVAIARIVGDEEAGLERFAKEQDVDLSFSQPNGYRFRANLSMTSDGFLVVCRVIRAEITPLDELGFSPQSLRAIKTILRRKRGLVLVTGPTGSGKSTTLAAMVNWFNGEGASNIITIEDPIEYVFISNRSAIHQREVGSHTRSFAGALRSAMRQAPDVILVGEMRDGETIKAVLTAAETGHLVLSTLHTRSAPETLSRIVDALPAEDKPMALQQLSASLAAVISQKLLPTVGGQLALAYEMFVQTDAVRSVIAKGEASASVEIRNYMRAGRDWGMSLMEQSLAELVSSGRVLPEVAELYANDAEDLRSLLKALGAGGERGRPPFGGQGPEGGVEARGPRGKLFGGG